MYFDKLTIIIVTFHSHVIIEKCVDNLDERYKKIIVENSDNIQFAKKLINKRPFKPDQPRYAPAECDNLLPCGISLGI